MTACLLRRTAEDRKLGNARRRDVGVADQQQGHVHARGELAGGIERDVIVSDDQDDTGAVHGDGSRAGDFEHRFGDQCAHLGPGVARLRRPAGLLADIDEAQVTTEFGIVCDFQEQRGFLRAADQQRLIAFERGLEAVDLLATELRAANVERGAGGSLDGCAIQRARFLAVTGQDLKALLGLRCRHAVAALRVAVFVYLLRAALRLAKGRAYCSQAL